MAPRRTTKAKPLIRADNLGIKFRINRQRPMSTRARERFTRAGVRARRARGVEEFWALRGVSFSVDRGEAIGLIGGNGHGKSTLLRLMAGVMIPDEGKIRVRGQVAPMIEVTGGFVNDLTVRDNIWLAAGLKGLSKRQIEEKFDSIVEWAEIAHRLDTPLRHLSSGMRAKVGFSVITSVDRPIVLIDEVLSVGDRAFKKKCFDRMDDMLGHGKTVVLVSHSDGHIRRFCKRGLYLRHGELILDGPIDDALGRYAADIEATVRERNGGAAGSVSRAEERVARKARRRARRKALAAANAGAGAGGGSADGPMVDNVVPGQLAFDDLWRDPERDATPS